MEKIPPTSIMRGFFFFFVSLVSLPAAPVELVVVPENQTTTVYMTDNGLAVAQSETSGSILADLTLLPGTGMPSQIRFTGGTLAYSDSVTVYTPNQLPQVDEYRFTGTGLGSTLSTVTTPASIAQPGGFLNNNDHRITLNQGTLRTQYFLFGFPLADSITNFATHPAETTINGTTTVQSSLLASGPIMDRFQVTFTHVADPSPEPIIGGGVTIEVSSDGGFTAVGEMLVASPGFHQWMIDSGQPAPQSIQATAGAVPGAVLYALGLPAGATAIPWTIDTENSQVIFELPASGTRAPVFLEFGTSLGNWQILGGDSATPTLPAGSSGTHIIPFPPDTTAFFRLFTRA
jgi:hypothetical protein